jgi:hypothetical protein
MDNVQKLKNFINIILSQILHDFHCFTNNIHNICRGTLYRRWSRHYATSRKVASSIPDEIIGFLNLPNLSSRTMALESTQKSSWG